MNLFQAMKDYEIDIPATDWIYFDDFADLNVESLVYIGAHGSTPESNFVHNCNVAVASYMTLPFVEHGDNRWAIISTAQELQEFYKLTSELSDSSWGDPEKKTAKLDEFIKENHLIGHFA